MTIRQLLMGLSALGTALTVAVGAAGLWGLQDLTQAQDEATTATQATQAATVGGLMREGLRGDVYRSIVLAQDDQPDGQAQTIQDARQHGQELMRRVEALRQLDLSPAQKQITEDLAPMVARYTATGLEITRQASTDVEAATARLPHFVALFRQLETQQGKLITTLETQAQASHDTADRAHTRSLWLLLAIAMSGSALLAGVATWVGRRLWSTLGAEPAALRKLLFRVAGGELNLRIALAPGDDTSVLAGLAHMAERLRNTPPRHSTEHVYEVLRQLDGLTLHAPPVRRTSVSQSVRTEDHVT